MKVNIHEAKTQLSKLLEHVALGEEVIIAKAGRPIAKLVPIRQKKRKSLIGSGEGDFVVPDDFDAPLPRDVEDLFWK